MALVMIAVAAADDAAAQILNRTSQSVSALAGWTDHPIRPGVTSIKAAHFDELRERIEALRAREGLPPARWTDPVLAPRGNHGQADPAGYDGWFVQLLMNRGDGTFTDETSLRLQPHEQSSGNAGVATNAPHPRRVQVLDFNGDGAPDFAMQAHLPLPPNVPLVWLNDGRFWALKVHDFFPPAGHHEWQWLLADAFFMRTRHGYSLFAMLSVSATGTPGLTLAGLLATRPYR